MASVKQFPKSSHWYACYKVPTGQSDAKGRPIFKRVQRSTGIDDKSRAEQIAISYERAAVAVSEKRWTENTARRFMTELNAVAGVSVGDVEPTNAFLDRWLASRKKSLGEASFTRYEGVINAFKEFLGANAGAPLGDVTHAVVIKFRDAEIARGIASTTVNAGLLVLGQAFKQAVISKTLDGNPAKGINTKPDKAKKQKRKPFTFEQFRLLVERTSPEYVVPDRTNWKNYKLHGDWQTFVLLLGYTGGRQQEVAKLTWEQIDLGKKVLTLGRTKTSDEHWTPIHPALEKKLHALNPDGKKKGPVLPMLSVLVRRRISNAFRRQILPRIGIKQAFADNEGEGRTVAEYSIHSLRHSLSTWLAEAGVEEKMRMELIGHETTEVNRGYTHAAIEQRSEAMNKIPSV